MFGSPVFQSIVGLINTHVLAEVKKSRNKAPDTYIRGLLDNLIFLYHSIQNALMRDPQGGRGGSGGVISDVFVSMRAMPHISHFGSIQL